MTAAEQREKDHRRQRRLAREAEQERERIAALERQHAEDERRRAAVEAAQKRREEELERRRIEDRRKEMEARQRRTAEDEQRQIVARKAEMEAREKRRREDRERREERMRQRESDTLFGGPRVTQTTRKLLPEARAVNPAFGGTASQYQNHREWGGVEDDIKPIQYNEKPEARAEVQQEPSETAQTQENKPKPPIRTAVSARSGPLNTKVHQRSTSARVRRRSRPSGPSFDNDAPQDITGNQWGASAEDIRPIEYRTHTERPKQEPAARSDPLRSCSDFEYQAMPFKLEDYLNSSTRPASDNEDSWSHLRPAKESAPTSYSSLNLPLVQAQKQTPANPFENPEEIERSFRAHQQQRSQRRHSKSISPTWNPSLGTITGIPHSIPRCGRCLEQGHSARECTGPVRARCNFCGEIGHLAASCPKNSVASKQAVSGLPHEGEGPFTQTRRAESNAPPVVRRFDSEGTPSAFDMTDKIGDRRSSPEQAPKQDVEELSTFSPFSTHEDQPNKKPKSTRSVVSGESLSQSRGWIEDEANNKEDEITNRRARRSARGFDDGISVAERFDERRDRPKSRRSFEARNNDLDEAELDAREERAARKAERKAARKAALAEQRAALHLPEFVSVQNLAQLLNVHYESFVQRLDKLGYEDIFPGKVLSREISGMIAMEYSFDPVFQDDIAGQDGAEHDLHPAPEIEDQSSLPLRPPVVTVMGHVDHGKTTILDYLRKSSVAAGEAGGITQHIGAFSVPIPSQDGEKAITFLDTPGHAAFLSMRQRGANVTDIVVLVVAADDSVKPQTLESLRCAREANVPILVAINKIDKEGADVQRVKNDLSQHGVEIEAFGGDVQVVEVSGKTGQGMETLTEAIVTLGEILEKKADLDGAVEGWVLEATTSKTSGRVATVLVKRGTLKAGDVLVAGTTWARVKTLRDERGEVVESATPGMPVEVDGWREQPSAGDQVLQALDGEHKAGQVVEYRIERSEREKLETDMQAINEARRMEQLKKADKQKSSRFAAYADMYDSITNGEEAPNDTTKPADAEKEEPQGQITVPFVIKADVSGSAEAVAAYIPSLTTPLIAPQIILSAVGPVKPSDIDRASAAKGHIIAFNLPPDESTKGVALKEGVKILENNIIYRVLDDVKEVLEEKLPPVLTQRVIGEAEVSATFDISVGGRKTMKIAGCKVRNGTIGMRSRVRVTRRNSGEKVYDGKLGTIFNGGCPFLCAFR